MEAARHSRARSSGDKAQRIVDAMRASVARRGVAGSTFDHVAREAGVSRGLLHYYFGTKERLLAEVVRRDCDLRMARARRAARAARDRRRLHRRCSSSRSRDSSREDPDFVTLVFELFTLSRRNEEIAAEFAELLRRTREHVAELLARQAGRGRRCTCAPSPRPSPTCSSRWPTGSRLRMLAEPDRDFGATHRRGRRSPSARCSTTGRRRRAPRSIGAMDLRPSRSPSRTPTAPTPTRPASR